MFCQIKQCCSFDLVTCLKPQSTVNRREWVWVIMTDKGGRLLIKRVIVLPQGTVVSVVCQGKWVGKNWVCFFDEQVREVFAQWPLSLGSLPEWWLHEVLSISSVSPCIIQKGNSSSRKWFGLLLQRGCMWRRTPSPPILSSAPPLTILFSKLRC